MIPAHRPRFRLLILSLVAGGCWPEKAMTTQGALDTGTADPNDTEPDDTDDTQIIDTANPWDPETLAGAGWLQGRDIGAAVSTSAFSDDTDYVTLFGEQFSSFTPENATKWGSLQSDKGVWDFSTAESMLEYAEAQGMVFRGHTLAWHYQMPDWIEDETDPAIFEQAVNDHFEAVAAWDAGRIETWDVVNEAINDDGSVRESTWSEHLGDQWMAEMFVLADTHFPHAKLFYNDYSISWLNTKSDAVYAMAEQMVADGIPVDGIGMQMHVLTGSAPEPEDLATNIRRFGDLGLEVHITELDVQMRDVAGADEARLYAQSRTWYRVVGACISEPACTSITFWGFTDRYSWIDTWYGEDDPLPWDDDLQTKPAFDAIMAALREEPLPGCGEELVLNGDFESGIDEWYTWGNTIEASNNAHSGSGAVLVTDREDTWNGVVQDITGLVAETIPYEASAWVMLDGASSDTVSLTLLVEDETETTWTHISDETATSSGWTELSGTITIDAGDSLQSVELYVEGPAPGVDMLVDDVSFVPSCSL